MNINSGVYAVILNENKEVLMIHRTDHDLWEIPGGKWEEDETPWQAAIREVEEETGLQVEVEKIVSLGSRPERQDLVFTFLCKIIGGEIKHTREADDIQYFSLENIPPNTAPSKLERIKDVLAMQEQCFLRDISQSVKTEDFVEENKL
ncbi:MAG: NUDIX hydrolase [Candidatus Magasanikbacteria bacterium]